MELETKLPVPDREARKTIENNFQKIQEALSELQNQIDSYVQRIEDLESEVAQLQKDDANHAARLQRIEQLLFGSQSVNATVTNTDDGDHQGYSISDIPPYDYEQD